MFAKIAISCPCKNYARARKGGKKKKKSQMLLNVAHHLFIINLLSVNTRLER